MHQLAGLYLLVGAAVPGLSPISAASLDPAPAIPVNHVGALLLALAVILVAAKVGGHLAEWLRQPAVLGELLAGVLLGNCGIAWLHGLGTDPAVDLFAQVGVVLLLFEVGLESRVVDVLQVGGRALLVAVLGVITPWILGWGLGALLLPDRSVYVHAFLGATLTATSVGITARVLKDLGHAQTREARIILGAAVIDDVLGLVVLAVVASVIKAADLGSSASLAETGVVILKAVAFMVGALTLGVLLTPYLFRVSARLRGSGVLLSTSLTFCFLLACLASNIGLAPIVGAYTAGLVLEEPHYLGFLGRDRSLPDLVSPVSSFLVPVFFVLMGIRVDLGAVLNPAAAWLALLLALVAIAGKQACALGGLGGGLDALSIGIGMIPRGEVGLIFASIGLSLTVHGERVVDPVTYSAVVLMVMITTLVTPPALKWSLARGRGRGGTGG
jgi:Kef-type K+ transport system membrane component KefB